MKQFLLLGFLFAALQITSAATFTLNLYNGNGYLISFDGYRSRVNGQHIRFDNLTPGYHNLSIFRQGYDRFGRFRNFHIYQGEVFIPQGHVVTAGLNGYNSFVIESTLPIRPVYPAYPSNPVCHTGMHPTTFFNLQHTLQSVSFDSRRYTMAMHAIASNGISTAQLRDLLAMFSFESYRLELAKFAYQHTADRRSYFMINDQFSFSSSIDELYRFIGS